jgi:hypothetical protein
MSRGGRPEKKNGVGVLLKKRKSGRIRAFETPSINTTRASRK